MNWQKAKKPESVLHWYQFLLAIAITLNRIDIRPCRHWSHGGHDLQQIAFLKASTHSRAFRLYLAA
jgi:hypothetical protein